MSQVALFSLLMPTKFGGAMVYTAQLAQALRAQGHTPFLFRVCARMSKGLKPYTNGELHQDIHLKGAIAVAESMPSLITYVAPWEDYSEAALALVAAGAHATLHDPADMAPAYVEALRARGTRVVAIRRTGEAKMREMGLDATYIPHPYARVAPTKVMVPPHERIQAVSVTRIDWRKYTHVICEANTLLEKHQRIQMHGALNRLYAHSTLDQKFPSWRDDYHGTYPPEEGAAVAINERASMSVDLTEISGGGWDGGGTQYSFLEAWDAGAPLVVKRSWTRPNDSVREGETALAVDSAAELADVVRRGYDFEVVKGGWRELKHHTADQVIPQYAKLLGL